MNTNQTNQVQKTFNYNDIKIDKLITHDVYKHSNSPNFPKILGKYIAGTYCGFDEKELDMIDLYWDVAFNDSWLYVSEELVITLGYTIVRDLFKRVLKPHFEENHDYKNVNDDHVLVKLYRDSCLGKKDTRGGALKKHYIITAKELYVF